jgi:hypothetical protein
MSDVRINLDANIAPAEAKVRRLDQALANTAGNWQKRVEFSMKALSGNTEGGIGVGTFKALAGGLGMVAVAAIAAGSAYRGMTSASDRAVENAKTEVEWQTKVAQALRKSSEARDATAAGGVSQLTDIRKALGRGVSMSTIKDTAGQGVPWEEAVKGEAALARSTAPDFFRKIAMRMFRTGEIGFGDASKAVSESGNIKTTDDIARTILKATGQEITPRSMGMMLDQLKRTDEWNGGNIKLDRFRPIVNAGNRVPGAQADDLVSGRSADAINKQADNTLDPFSKAMSDMAIEAAATQKALDAGAKAQGNLVALLKTALMAVGGEGSERYKANRYRAQVAGALGDG